MPSKVKCMGLYSTRLVQVHRDFGFSVQSASPAFGRCSVLACESMLFGSVVFVFVSWPLLRFRVLYCVLVSDPYLYFRSFCCLPYDSFIASAKANSADCELMLCLVIFSILSFP
jgi:hypothetical protein